MALTTRSLTFKSSIPSHLTNGSGGNGFTQGTTFTAAFWFKRTAAGIGNINNLFYFGSDGSGVYNYTVGQFNINNRIEVYSNNTTQSFCADFVTNQQITDTLWHHCCVQVGSTISVAIDGVSSPQFSSGNVGGYQVLDYGTWSIGGGNAGTIGAMVLDAELDLFYVCDGYNYPSSWFRSSTGQPIAFTGNFGGGGFFLNFDNNSSLSALGTDSGGNAINWTATGFVLGTDSTTDVPGGIPINPIPFGAGGLLRVDGVARHPIWDGAAALSSAGALAITTSVRQSRQPGTPAPFVSAAALVATGRTVSRVGVVAASAGGGVAMLPPNVSIAIDPRSARSAFIVASRLYADSKILTQLDVYSLDIVARVKMLIPNRWFAWVAPYRDAVLGGIADATAWCRYLIDYARKQSRLATASGIWLDIFAFDYVRRYLLRRGATDDVFRVKIKATILQERVTRAGMNYAINQLTSSPPAIFEPWNTGDAGGWGSGLFALNRAGGWGSIQLPGQAFVKVSRAGIGPTGVPNVAGLLPPGGTPGLGGYGTGAVEYVGPSVSQIGVTDPDIYQIIVQTKPSGTTIWTRID